MPPEIAKQTKEWDFNAARLTYADAARALDAYMTARERLHAPRGVWDRFGLLGKDPERHLGKAADAFAAGEFDAANDYATLASQTVNNASDVALRRLVMLACVLGVIAGGVAVGGWFTRRRESEDY
jgi:hypothetical protein